jgi:hypothetical protein
MFGLALFIGVSIRTGVPIQFDGFLRHFLVLVNSRRITEESNFADLSIVTTSHGSNLIRFFEGKD